LSRLEVTFLQKLPMPAPLHLDDAAPPPEDTWPDNPRNCFSFNYDFASKNKGLRLELISDG
jgi:hypothetical protein